MRTQGIHVLIRTLPFAIAALLVAGCGRSEGPRVVSTPVTSVNAQTLTVGKTRSVGGYEATGTVKAVLNATLSSKVMGRVIDVFVREGDFVKKGQLLVSIDSRELEAATNVAAANYDASVVGVGSAQKALEIEHRTSKARIAQAESQVQQAQAGLAIAKSRLDLVLAGPRSQEVSQTHIAVTQAQSSLNLAKIELDRMTSLYEKGAVARREVDLAQNRFDLAKGQYEAAVQSESIAREGSRSQEIQGARDAVTQADAALKQAQSGLAQAKAAALQVSLRQKDVEVANAQVRQASAVFRSAKVSLSYGQVVAPFDGRVTQRSIDPGAMASPGVSLLTLEGGGLRLEAAVPESVLGSISLGSKAPIRVDALPAGSVMGQVVEIVPEGDAVSHSFVVKFSLGDLAGLRSGMFGRAMIPTGTTHQIFIPSSATWEREGLNYVFAINSDGIARLRIITVGDSMRDQVPVLSGLHGGDRIVVGDRSQVFDGCRIEGSER